MTILQRADVTQALRLRFEEDRRYHVLRNLLPICEWPLCLYNPAITEGARQDRQNERREAGTLARKVTDARTAEDNQALYDDLLSRVRTKAEENGLLWMLRPTPLVLWEEEVIREFTRSVLEREAASTDEGERRRLHMDLSTLAWVLGFPAGETDAAAVVTLCRELEVEGAAREQGKTPGSNVPLWGSYPGSWEDIQAARLEQRSPPQPATSSFWRCGSIGCWGKKNGREERSGRAMPNTRQDAVPATLELPVVPAGTVFPVWRVPWHSQTPAQRRLHAGDAMLGERGRLSIVLGEAATRPPTISELLDALELPPTLPRRRRKQRRSVPLPPVRLPLLLELHLPPGAALDVEALRRGTVVRLDNLVSPRAEVRQPSGAPLGAQTWLIGRPDSLDVRLLQIVLPHPPEPDTTLLVRPANPWIDPPAPRLAPPEEMQEVIKLFWPGEKEEDGEEGGAD